MRYIISICLLGLAVCCHAQEGKSEVEVMPDSSRVEVTKPVSEKRVKDFKPSAVNVGADVLGLGRSILEGGFSLIEAQADIDFDRYFLVLDLGRENHALSNGQFNYSNRGNYMRLGIHINMMPYNPDRNFFFLGFRYARASFNDYIEFTDDFDKWGARDFELQNSGVSANWLQASMGMRVKVLPSLYFGYTIRYNFSKRMSGYGLLEPKNIPGFGKAGKNSNVGFSYYMLYHLPFRDKPVPKRPKRIHRERSNKDRERQSPSQSIQSIRQAF